LTLCRFTRRHLQQWDQAAWNEVILSFLVGMGYEEPLRYRILPVDQFSNIGAALRCRAASPCQIFYFLSKCRI